MDKMVNARPVGLIIEEDSYFLKCELKDENNMCTYLMDKILDMRIINQFIDNSVVYSK